jgi:hypothetical protein
MPVDVSGVSDDAKNLDIFLQEVLSRVINVYDSYDMPLPARRYYTFGAPVIDCEQLVVSLAQLYLGTPGDEVSEPRRCNDPRTATLNISVSREVPIVQPNGNPPTTQSVIEANRVGAYDSWILMESINNLDTWASPGGYGLGVIATLDFEEPQGGFQTTVLTITMAVP